MPIHAGNIIIGVPPPESKETVKAGRIIIGPVPVVDVDTYPIRLESFDSSNNKIVDAIASVGGIALTPPLNAKEQFLLNKTVITRT